MTAPTNPLELLKLEKGWDTYDADPPSPKVVDMAAKLGAALATVIDDDLYYVPCGDGSVQIEYHSLGWDIECLIQEYKP